VIVAPVAHRINGERLVILSWPRAILMQLAHPLIAAGVEQHSAFHGGVTQAAARLHHTVRAMLAITFGDEARRAAAVDRISGIHRKVNGTLPQAVGRFPAGTRYSAEDPALLLWVHATLLESSADLYQRLVAPLSEEERDAYCVESLPLLLDLGGDPGAAPRTWAALERYIADIEHSGTLAAAASTRALADAILTPRAGTWALRFGGLNQLLTVGLLSLPVRAVYDYQWNARHEARFARTVRIIRATRRRSPDIVARWHDARR
jgi:uncharacterized protein (DUF2236 family)